MAPPNTQLRPLYRNRDYMLLWSGQFVSSLGSIPIGAALAGILIERFGAEKTVLFYSVCYGFCELATFFNPHVRAVKSVG